MRKQKRIKTNQLDIATAARIASGDNRIVYFRGATLTLAALRSSHNLCMLLAIMSEADWATDSFFFGGDWWEFKSPTYQLSSAAHKRRVRPRPLKPDRGLCCSSRKIAAFSRRAGASMEIKMFHGGKMNRCIIIQMQSYATQSLGVKCANASLRAGPRVKKRSRRRK